MYKGRGGVCQSCRTALLEDAPDQTRVAQLGKGLFISQCDYGFDAHCATRRDGARSQCNER
jgi:hypothetical protein